MHERREHTDEPYSGPERRTLTADRVALMIEETVDERLAKTESNLIAHINHKMGEIHKIFTDHVDEAFVLPLHKHREYHEEKVKAANFAEKIKADLTGWALKGIIVFAVGLVFLGAKEWLLRELSKPQVVVQQPPSK